MRTLRLSLVGMVILALLGGLGGTVVGQDEEPWSGDWLEPTEEGVFGPAGHDLPWCELDKSERDAELGPGGRGKEVRNLLFTCEVVFSDSRLTGTQTTRLNERCWTDEGCVNWGTMEIIGSEGSWSGWFNGTEDLMGLTNLHIVLTGSGAYEGLTNIRHASGRFYSALTQSGVIYNSDPPPVPAE